MSTYYNDYLDKMREFENNIKVSFSSLFPIEYSNYRVEGTNIKVDMPDLSDVKTFQDAKLQKQTLLADVSADVSIAVDGKVSAKASGVRVGKVPVMTTRGTFMVEGKEYNLPTQLRLGYGVFVHKTGPGDIVTQFNVDIGIGFKLLYDPEKKIFQINARGKILGLLPILVTIGVSHDDLRNSWGAEVYDANVKKYPPTSFKREITKGNEIFSNKEVNDSDLLKSTLKSFTFDPDINKASIGMEEANLSSGLILAASKKMLMVQEGKEKPIDRDSLQYKYVIGTDEYFDERIRAAAANAKQRIITKLKKNGPDIGKVFEFDYMTGPILAMLKKYTQVSYASQQNPLSWLGDRRKVTIVGTGGIEDARQLTPNALRINPSTFGFIDPVFTPDGDKVGALNRVSSGTYIRDKKFWKQVYDLKAKKVKTINHIDLIASTWAAGDEYKRVGSELKPINAVVRGHKNGVFGEYKPAEIDYVVSTDNFFNEVVLNLPFVSNNQGLRVTYGAKMIPQALPLKNGEVRLVRPMVNNIVSNENIDVGRTIAQQTPDLFIQSPVAGTVSNVSDEEVQIKDNDGKKFKINIYNYMPLNEESFINHTATVKVGDKVKKDQIIAESPFTKDGDLSIGVHLRSAYLPFRGQTIDDSVVISETAAKKMTSLHLYQFDVEYDPDTDKKELSFFKAQFPTKVKPKVLSKLGADGIVKAGEIVESGDYLAIKVRRRQAEEYNSLSKIHRSLIKPWVDMSLVWEEDVPGKVVRVVGGGDSVAIHISTEEAMLVGDKLTGSAANKATVGAILPDGEMPMNSKGQYMELLMSPATIPSRINPGQIIESAAAKVSEFTGKPMDVEQFDHDHVAKKVYDEMKWYGIEGKEELTLGNRKMKAFVGPQYIMKLEHQSRKKGSARYQAGYDANMQPTKTDGSPAGESMDALTLYSLIGHDANANLRDALRKGEKNVDMWSDLEMGRPVGGVKVPYTFNKMFSYLEGAGVKVNRGNGIIQLLPATDKDIMAKSSGEITNSNQVYGKNLKPITGGLYDLDILGGKDNSSRNAHINLPSKIPNPLVVEYLAPVLKLKTAEMEDIAREKIWINVYTREVKEKKMPGFLTGWPAFKELIKDVNIDQRLEELTELMVSEKNTTKLSGLIREKRILNMLKANHMELSDMFLSKMLILPSALRPIYISGTGEMVSSEMNKFYKNTILATQKYKELADMGVAEDDRSMKKLRSQIYDEYKAYQGLVVPSDNDPVGILRHIKGRAESKHGFFWSKVVNRKQDLSGHAVIGPDINLGVDDIVLPKEQAWKLFDPFTLKKMIAGGYNPLEAKKHLVDHDDVAYKAMLSVAKERPVLINRNPSLHKFNLMAVNAEIRDAKQIKLNPIVHKLFNMDFDGDQQVATVIICLTKDNIGNILPSDASWWGARRIKMSARIREQLLCGRDGEFYCMDLSEVPHSVDYVEKKHIRFHGVERGIFAVAYNENSGTPILAELGGWSEHTGCKVEIVTLGSGRQIYTDDDDRAVYGMDSKTFEMKRSRPSEAIGMMVPRCERIPESKPTITSIPTNNLHQKFWANVKLDREFGYLLGVAIGDGWISRAKDKIKGVAVAGVCSKVFDRFTNALLTVFQEVPTVCRQSSKKDSSRYGDCNKLTISNSAFGKFLLPLIGKLANGKHLPTFFSMAPREFQLGLIEGLWDTDGTLSISHGKKIPQMQVAYSSNSLRLIREIQHLLRLLGVRSRSTVGKTPKGNPCWILVPGVVDFKSLNLHFQSPQKQKVFIDGVSPNMSSASANRIDLLPFSPELRDIVTARLDGKDKKYYSLLIMTYKAGIAGKITRTVAKRLIDIFGNSINHPHWIKFIQMCENKFVTWDRVEGFERTELVETGYDLTVPGFETFMNTDGVILSNTASIYVPVSNDAVTEAKTMYPSTTLWHPGNRQLMMEVYYDGILGLYKGSVAGNGAYKAFSSLDAAIDEYEADKLSLDSNVSIGTIKTTLGRYWINSFIPTVYRRYDIQFDKKNVKEILDKIAKGSAPELPTTIKELQKIGVKFATEVGATIGIEDLVIDNKERDKFFGRVKTEMAKGGEGVVEKLVEEAKKMIYNIDSKNELMVMMNSGTKGDVNQVGQMLFSPLFVSDHEGKIIKTPIVGSYAEGLSVSDYLNTMPGSRLGAIAKKKEVSEPGYLNKLLVTATADEVISMRDCGTTVGISMDVDDPDSEGRVLSKPAGAYHRGIVLTPNILTDLKRKKIKSVDVRSSVKCIAPRGICQMCYGIDEYGAFPTIGRNVGMIAAQSISEPLSQGSLSLFHSAGTAMGGTATMSLMDKTMHLLKIPQDSLADATLSKVNGRVTNINKVPGGGSTITIKGIGDAVDYFIHPSKVVSVKKGDMISRGDKLSGGELNFRDYFGIVGKDRAQASMVSELSNAYTSNGNKLDKRVFEVVTKAMTNSAVVKDPGSSMISIKNDVVPYNFISFVNKSIRNKTPMELNYAIGYSLGKKYGRFDKGEIVTAEVVSGLRNVGIKEVIIDGDQVKIEPSIQGIVQIPQRNFDILEKMPGEGMVENLVKGIVSGIYAETGDPFQKLQRYITGKV